MTGSLRAAVPGTHIASCTASLAVARALASFAAAASRTARSAAWPTSAPGTASGPCRSVRACAASTRDRRASGPPAASSRREASRSRSSSSAFCAPDLYPSVWMPSAARASPTASPAARLASAA